MYKPCVFKTTNTNFKCQRENSNISFLVNIQYISMPSFKIAQKIIKFCCNTETKRLQFTKIRLTTKVGQ